MEKLFTPSSSGHVCCLETNAKENTCASCQIISNPRLCWQESMDVLVKSPSSLKCPSSSVFSAVSIIPIPSSIPLTGSNNETNPPSCAAMRFASASASASCLARAAEAWTCWGWLLDGWEVSGTYPLVMTNIAMENHHFQWENSLFLWPFSIATLNYQRVPISK